MIEPDQREPIIWPRTARYRFEPPDARDVFFFLGAVLIGCGIYMLEPAALGGYLLTLGIAILAAVAWGLVKAGRRGSDN